MNTAGNIVELGLLAILGVVCWMISTLAVYGVLFPAGISMIAPQFIAA